MLSDLVAYAETVEGELPPAFHRSRAVRWQIRLQSGTAPRIDPAGEGKGIAMDVPMIQRSGKAAAAMFIVDSAEYVLGVPRDPSPKAAADAAAKHAAYHSLIQAFAREEPDDPGVGRIAEMLLAGEAANLRASLTGQGGSATDVVAFLVDGQYAHETLAGRRFWSIEAGRRKGADEHGHCLICRRHGALLDSLPVQIPGALIPVTDSSGAPARGSDTQLMSINTLAQARAGRLRLASTPICPRCGTLAVAGLTKLLTDDHSRRRGRDSVLVWWHTGKPTGISPIGEIERPDPTTVAAMIAQVDWPLVTFGHTEDVATFHAVTLSARKARVVVHDHLTVPIPRLERTLGRWFQDTEIGREPSRYHPRLRSLINAAGRWEPARERYAKDSEPLGLDRALLECALRGSRPPVWLLPHLLTRIARDGHLSADRAALLRLSLLRSPTQLTPPAEVAMPYLHEDCEDRAYVAGRLMAVLEAIQLAAIPEIRTTLSVRYRSAARNPIILAQLVGNATVHLARLRTEGNQSAEKALANRLGSVLGLLKQDTAFPAAHTLAEQGSYHLGYYHQRNADREARNQAAEDKRNRQAPDTSPSA